MVVINLNTLLLARWIFFHIICGIVLSKELFSRNIEKQVRIQFPSTILFSVGIKRIKEIKFSFVFLDCFFAYAHLIWRGLWTVAVVSVINRSSHQRCSVWKCVLRNFTKFTEKHLCQGLFRAAMKREPLAQVFSSEFHEILNTFFHRTSLVAASELNVSLRF